MSHSMQRGRLRSAANCSGVGRGLRYSGFFTTLVRLTLFFMCFSSSIALDPHRNYLHITSGAYGNGLAAQNGDFSGFARRLDSLSVCTDGSSTVNVSVLDTGDSRSGSLSPSYSTNGLFSSLTVSDLGGYSSCGALASAGTGTSELIMLELNLLSL